jgi:hypothetical protein
MYKMILLKTIRMNDRAAVSEVIRRNFITLIFLPIQWIFYATATKIAVFNALSTENEETAYSDAIRPPITIKSGHTRGSVLEELTAARVNPLPRR